MARLPRYVIPGQPQHIIQRGNNRQAIFGAEPDYRFFRDALVEAAAQHGLAIHAYVWMTNHVHLLATPALEDSISKTFQSVGRRYVQYFNHAYQRSGTLWEGRYRATVVDSERYLLTLMRYIELNPVRGKNGVRHDIRPMLNPSCPPARSQPWHVFPATSFPASRSTSSSAAITGRRSSAPNRITASSAMRWWRLRRSTGWRFMRMCG